MTHNYHTPITTGAAANAVTFNSPMDSLDAQITVNTAEVSAARGSQPSLDSRLDQSLNNDGTIKASAVSAQSMVDLGTAAAASGDAVRYDEFTAEHSAAGAHSITRTVHVYADTAVGSGDGSPAAALAVYDKLDDDNLAEEQIRLAVWNNDWTFDDAVIRFEASVDGTGSADTPVVNLVVGAANTAVTVSEADTNWHSYSGTLDVSGLAAGVHELTVSLQWTGSTAAGAVTLSVRNIQIVFTYSA